MIDFRYHLVSIIAVFLALAVGLVLGATALSGPALSTLQRLEKTVSRNNSALLREKQALANQISADQTFAAAAAPKLLPGLLTGEKVVLVQASTPNPSIATGLTTALRQAGAEVTGTVTLNSPFLDTSGANEAHLKGLAYMLARNYGVSLPAELPGNVGAQQAAAKVLAASLLTSNGTVLSSADSRGILTGLSSQGGYVTASPTAIRPADLAVLITPGGPPSNLGSEVLVATAVALRNASRSHGTVMVGAVQSIGAPTPISAENNPTQVSTVDFADTQIGQITTVWALRQLLDGKPPAQYGIGPQAVPTPAPTPSVTPTLTPTPAVSSHPGGHK